MLIKVKAIPNSSKNEVIQKTENSFWVKTKEPAQDNRANNSVKELLAEKFKISPSRLRMIKGARTPSKIFEILENKMF